jgi:hypothetical protein
LERRGKTRHGGDQMDRTRFKGLGCKRIPNMKGLKKGLGVCKEDQEHQTCVKNMRRGSRTPSVWEEDQKHQACREAM